MTTKILPRRWCSATLLLLLFACHSSPVRSTVTITSDETRSSTQDDYWSERARILASEQSSFLGGSLGFEDGERAANEILVSAKRSEFDAGLNDPSRFLPSRNFLTVYEKVARSPTFRIIQSMPKGAILHAHDSALASGRWVYENITFRDNLYVCRGEDEKNGTISFLFATSEKITTLKSSAEVSEDPKENCDSSNGWELLADLRANETIAGDVNALVMSALTIIVPDPSVTYPNSKEAWKTFQNSFRVRGPLLEYKPVYADYFYRALEEYLEDNLLYLEFRTVLPTLYDLDGTSYGPLAVARLHKNVSDRFVADHPNFIGSKLIYAPPRSVSLADFDEYLSIMTALKSELPDFIAGFDLVGWEDRGEPLSKFADSLLRLSKDIKFFWHAGETNWYGMSVDENLIDAVLLNASRIGHGYALTKHPRLMEMVKERNIAIEVNPISNQVLGLVEDLRNHPASILFSDNYPVIVSSDDPGLWGAIGLSYDFYEAFVGIMPRFADIRALKQLAINSIEYSAMNDEEKKRALDLWQQQWNVFIADMVDGRCEA